MTDPHAGEPRPPSRVASVLIVIAGLVLLLPDLCVVITAVLTLPSLFANILRRGHTGDPQFLVVLAFWALFWLLCLGISYAGIRLIMRGTRD
jgi:succinate dehydrogenase/fumarate reductase cytochrome b subunit